MKDNDWTVVKIDAAIKDLEDKHKIDMAIKTDARKPEKVRAMIETIYEKNDKEFPNFTILSRARTKNNTPGSKGSSKRKGAATTGGMSKKKRK